MRRWSSPSTKSATKSSKKENTSASPSSRTTSNALRQASLSSPSLSTRPSPNITTARIQSQRSKSSRARGVTELVNTGEILTTTLKDVFTDVDIYENECRLLQYPFRSPIADNAISFYRYYLQDTLYIDKDKVVDVGFLPNNQQDFGFSGHLYILLDPDASNSPSLAEAMSTSSRT